MSEVILVDSHAIDVGKWLQQKGYELGDGGLDILEELTASRSLSILKPDPNPEPRKRVLGIMLSKPKQSLLAVALIYFNYYLPPNEDWRIDVHGSEYLSEIKQLAHEMAEHFGHKIWIQLLSEKPLKGPLLTIPKDWQSK